MTNVLKEKDRPELLYDKKGSKNQGMASKPLLKLDKNKALVSSAQYLPDGAIPPDVESCRMLAQKYGVVLVHSPLKILDRAFSDTDLKYKKFLKFLSVSPNNDLSVRFIGSSISKIVFKDALDGRKKNYIINMFPYGSTITEAMEFADELYRLFGIGLESFTSPASLITKILTTYCSGAFRNLDDTVEEYAYQCYKAGRFELVEGGTQDVDVYDVSSAYWWAVSTLQSAHFPFTEWKKQGVTLEDIRSENTAYAFCKCRVKVGAGRVSPLFMRKLDIHQCTRIITPTEITAEVWLTKPEIEVMLQSGSCSIEVLYGCVGKVLSRNNPFRSIGKQLFGMRKEFNVSVKNMVCTVPGKMASKFRYYDTKEGKWLVKTSSIFNMPYAAHSAGIIRAKSLGWMLRDPENTLRCSVDCITKKKGSAPPDVVSPGFGGITYESGMGFIATDLFADKPGVDKYSLSYNPADNTIKVGNKLDYPSITSLIRDDVNVVELNDVSKSVISRSGKRHSPPKGLNLSKEHYYARPTKGEKEVLDMLRLEENFDESTY